MNDLDRIRQVIADYLRAYEGRDATGCAAVYASDALVVSPWGSPVRGTGPIAAAHTGWFGENETNKIMTIEDLEISGDLAMCLVRYAADVPGDNGQQAKTFGCSLNTLRRQPDGNWKICHTSLNELEDFETGFSK